MTELRLTKRAKQHVAFMSLLISEPETSIQVLRANGIDTSQTMGSLNMSRRTERRVINQIKERINGSDNQG